MSKLHHCKNGVSVTDQVVKYQNTRECDDFVPVLEYYSEYKDIWYRQLSDHLDRKSFNSEFDFKLVKAADTFDETEARSLSIKFHWPLLGMFNRWFYRILSNWKSNVKTSSFRIKKRPPVLCPVCGRWTGRIDAEHLQHYKGTKDLPDYVAFKEEIFKVYLHPSLEVVSYGECTKKKLSHLNQGRTGEYSSFRTKKEWPWFLPTGELGVLCPLTKKIVKELTNEYICSLPDKVSRYSIPYKWEEFIEEFPHTLIQADVYSLDATSDDLSLGDQVSRDYKQETEGIDFDLSQIRNNKVSFKYEGVFCNIDKTVEDTTDRELLKLVAIGYSMEDVAFLLEIGTKELKKRIKQINTTSKELEQCLLEANHD